MTDYKWEIPKSVLYWINKAPKDEPVNLLLRHSVRDKECKEFTAPITSDGVGLARKLGALLGEILRSMHTSPFIRCIQTAESLLDGAGINLEIKADRLLGDPGIYVLDTQKAGKNWKLLGHEKIMDNLVCSDEAMPGMAVPDAAARYLVQHMLAESCGQPGIHVFVTHDAVIFPTTSRIMGKPLGQDAWPWYLEGAFFWRNKGECHVAYREWHDNYGPGPLCRFDDQDVIELARREASAVLGLDCPARYFLAGGAFKSLLNGHPPRDLDIWAPSDKDRDLLISTLRKKGAMQLEKKMFAESFEISERIVEIPYKTNASTLEKRLAQFDIALSAVGVGYKPGGTWRAVINPLAHESLENRQVLLIKPLFNWKYALVTLERMRRYAEELRFVIPEEETDEIWRVFDKQPIEMKKGMIARYDKAGLGLHGVRQEALDRLKEG